METHTDKVLHQGMQGRSTQVGERWWIDGSGSGTAIGFAGSDVEEIVIHDFFNRLVVESAGM